MNELTALVTLNAQPYLPLKKDDNGVYPMPTVRCGILPYYIDSKKQIIWGAVITNRVGPVIMTPPAGTQDILIIDTKSQSRFTLEIGKPFPSLGYEFLNEHVNKSFRGQDYQIILTCLENNKFDIYVENPLITAIHEAQEEHGLDLRPGSKDIELVRNIYQLPVLKLSGKQGATAQQFWLVSLNHSNGVILSNVNKIESKIRRNAGRKFYEKGCWATFEQFNHALIAAKTYEYRPSDETRQPNHELIPGALNAFEETIHLLGRIESVIKADFNKSVFPHGFYPYFSRASGEERHEVLAQSEVKMTLNPSLILLYNALNAMDAYGLKIGCEKGRMVHSHAQRLQENLNNFVLSVYLEDSRVNEELFKREFISLLYSKKHEMQKHRAQWKPIATNILIALTGIGLIVLIIKALSQTTNDTCRQKTTMFNNSLFFARTNTERLAENIDKEVTRFSIKKQNTEVHNIFVANTQL